MDPTHGIHFLQKHTSTTGVPMEPELKKKRLSNQWSGFGYAIVVLAAALAVTAYTAILSNVLSDSVLQYEVKENTERADALYGEMDKTLTLSAFTGIDSEADMDTENYTMVQSFLSESRRLTDSSNMYTAKKNTDGNLVYVVDGLDRSHSNFHVPGTAVDSEISPYLERAYNGENVYSQDIVSTSHGHVLTACYPIHAADSDEVIGVMCIETGMDDTYEFITSHQRTMVQAAIIGLAVIVALAACVFLLMHFFRRKEQEDQRMLLSSYERLEDALARETKHSEIISALATIYTTIFQLDLRTHAYEVIESVDLMGGVAGKGGASIEEVIEGILSAFMAPEMVDSMREFLDLDTLPARMATANTLMTEYRNPEGRWFQARFIAKRRDADGNLIEALYCARDFTDEKKRELELQEKLMASAEEAKRANLSKTNFLRRMSHDIRTPLNGIIGMVKISERYKDDPEKRQECKAKMLHSIDYLMDLVNNVLDISKLESGSIELEHKPFDLRELLVKTIDVTGTNAAEHGLTLEGGKEESRIIHYKLIGSPTHLNRVLMNLASNAVKYNRPGGSVSLVATEISSTEDTVTYQFNCSDTGLGMSPEFQKRAFEPFTQEGKETTTSFSGSGLGLSIVKDVVELMGGTIELHSQENVGTTFIITLTFEIDHSEQVKPEVAPAIDVNVTGKRALLVEDNALNREIANFMLTDQGLIIDEADDGQQAIETFAKSEPGTYSYIFMDVMMPVMNGLEATRRIRQLNRPDAQSVPIIAMTANAFAEDRQACLDAGMNAHVGKPIEAQALHDAIQQFAKH